MSQTLEERIARLEREVDLLKSRRPEETKKDWIAQITGSFADDPDFDEIVRLGREMRQADRPKDEE
jgi:hypothetical protein